MWLVKAYISIVALTLAGPIIGQAQTTARPGDYSPGEHTQPIPHNVRSVMVHPSEEVTSLEQAIHMAQLIVDATVEKVLPSIGRNPQRPSAIETHSVMVVREILRGVLPKDANNKIILVQEGGTVGQWEERVPDDPLVKEGEHYILFLTPDDRSTPPNTSGLPRFCAVGIWAGRIKVEESRVRVVPRAAEELLSHDKQDVGEFVTVVRQTIDRIVPKEQIIITPQNLVREKGK